MKCFSYSWPYVLDLCANNCIHWVLVSVPILTAPIDHSTIGAFNDISAHATCYTTSSLLKHYQHLGLCQKQCFLGQTLKHTR